MDWVVCYLTIKGHFENDALNALYGFQLRLSHMGVTSKNNACRPTAVTCVKTENASKSIFDAPPRVKNSDEPVRVRHGFDDGRMEHHKRIDARCVHAKVCPTTRGFVAGQCLTLGT